MMTFSKAVCGCAVVSTLALGLSAPAFADDDAQPSLTGHVDLVSKYVLRGITSTYGPSKPGGKNELADAPESDKPALQWGADWSHPSGFYLGYWASQINYSYKQLGNSYSDRSISNFQTDKSVENDFYGGYNGNIGDLRYTIGLTGYAYLNGSHSNAFETKLGISYGDFSLNAQTLLKDVVWGNKGDTYWTLNFNKEVVYKINFLASLGYYTYAKEGKFLGTVDTASGTACATGESFVVNACLAGKGPSSGGFRHLILGFTQPIAESGVTWGLQAIIGGENRFGVNQKNMVTGSISYAF